MNTNNSKNNINKTNSCCEAPEQQTLKPQTFKVLKSSYRRACYLLKKIEQNKITGNIHDRDATDEIACKNVIEEYKRYLNNKQEHSSISSIRNGEEKLPIDDPNSKRSKNNITSPARGDDDDHLLLGFVNEDFSKNRYVSDLWTEIESKLTMMIMDYVMAASKNDPMPCYDTSKVFRGCRLIKCMDQFSKDLIVDYVSKISNSWQGLVIKLIPAREIPRRTCARIWLPKITKPDNDTLLQCLRLHNPSIPMDDWHVIRAEAPNKNGLSYLLLIGDESVDALKKADNKLRFGVRNAKVKIFRNSKME